MAQVNTVAVENNPYLYSKYDTAVANSNEGTVSVFNEETSSECTDGNDDGKIGLGSAIGNTLKGAANGLINGIKGCFTDSEGNFSLGQTLKTAGMTALCFVPCVGPVIAGGLCTYGAVKGATGVVKGIASAATAETDAEAKEAFQSIGGSGLQTGLSVVGIKASANAIASNAKTLTAAKSSAYESATGITGKVTALAKDAINSTKSYYGGAWKEGALVKVGQKALTGTGDNILNTAKAAGDKLTKKSGTISDKKLDKLVKKGKVEAQTASDGTTFYTEKTKGANRKVYTQKAGTEGSKYSYTTEKNNVTTTFSEAPKTQSKEVAVNEIADSAKAQVTGLKKGESITIDGATYKALGDNRFKVTTETGATKTVKTTTENYSSLKKALKSTDMTKAQYSSLKKSGGAVTLEDGTVVTFDKGTGAATVSKTTDSSAFAKHFSEIKGYEGANGKTVAWGLLTSNMDED